MNKEIEAAYEHHKQAAIDPGRLVRLSVALTPEEYDKLMSLLGMAANDPADDDHSALESLRNKFAESENNYKVGRRDIRTVMPICLPVDAEKNSHIRHRISSDQDSAFMGCESKRNDRRNNESM
jgi:hypothetical protein